MCVLFGVFVCIVYGFAFFPGHLFGPFTTILWTFLVIPGKQKG